MAYRSYRTAPRSFTFSKSIFVCTVLQQTAFGEIWTTKIASRGLSARAYCLSLHDTRCRTEYRQDTPTRVIHASDPGIAHQAITITLPWFVWGKLNGLTALVVATSKRAFHSYHPKLRNCWCLRHETTRDLLQNTASHHRKNEENTWVWGMYDASGRVLTVFCVQLCTLTTWHCPRSPAARRPCSNRSIWPVEE